MLCAGKVIRCESKIGDWPEYIKNRHISDSYTQIGRVQCRRSTLSPLLVTDAAHEEVWTRRRREGLMVFGDPSDSLMTTRVPASYPDPRFLRSQSTYLCKWVELRIDLKCMRMAASCQD